MRKLLIFSAILALTAGVQAKNLSRSGWKWSASSICAAGEDFDIAGLPGIYDGDPTTCWHSNYRAQDGTPERNNPHWVMIDRGTDTSEFTGLAYLPRQSGENTSCIAYYIYLSDTDLSKTPASSTADIIAAIGLPDFSGYWNGDLTEKYVEFGTSYKSRYILFVNVQSKNSKSAACAEMNLYSGAPSSGTDPFNPETDEFNAIQITPYGADAKPHRIAIQGDKLKFEVKGDYVRLGNDDITVEYSMAEVARFSFEHYDFADKSGYDGDKKDIDTSIFYPSVKPAAGVIDQLDEITISISASRNHRINDEIEDAITLSHGAETILYIAPDELAGYAVEKGYAFSNLAITDPGTYRFEVPHRLFACADGTRSNYVVSEWTIKEPDSGIRDAEIPTLTFARNGNILALSGVSDAEVAELYNAVGQCLSSAPVDAFGAAELNVGALARGVYFLKLNATTLKIIL